MKKTVKYSKTPTVDLKRKIRRKIKHDNIEITKDIENTLDGRDRDLLIKLLTSLCTKK